MWYTWFTWYHNPYIKENCHFSGNTRKINMNYFNKNESGSILMNYIVIFSLNCIKRSIDSFQKSEKPKNMSQDLRKSLNVRLSLEYKYSLYRIWIIIIFLTLEMVLYWQFYLLFIKSFHLTDKKLRQKYFNKCGTLHSWY